MKFDEKFMGLVKGIYPALKLSSLCLKENSFKSRMEYCSSMVSCITIKIKIKWIKNQSP